MTNKARDPRARFIISRPFQGARAWSNGRMIHKELAYTDHIAQVCGIQFCVLSPDEIRSRSVAEITNSWTYVGTEPVPNGLFDTRMGVIDNSRVCKTCDQKNTLCPGHFGHVELALPVFYYQFFDIVKKLLKCVCFRCSRILVDAESPAVRAVVARTKHSMQRRWDAMVKLCAKGPHRCVREHGGCDARQPTKVTKTDNIYIEMTFAAEETDGPRAPEANEGRTVVLSAEDVLRILRRITDRDAETLGFSPRFNRPEWMICTVLPVPPPAVRPSVRTDTGGRSEDDLTNKLQDIIKCNQLLRAKLPVSTPEQIDMFTTVLQYNVATLVANSSTFKAADKSRTGRPLFALVDRLDGKEGRIRGSLMGKRVDFSSRTVITPDPNLSIDELGVPYKIAMNLTFPEVVHKKNLDDMYRLVRNGPDVYPGAKNIRKGTRTIRLKGNDLAGIVLEEGDVVERHLQNGDYVLFNRQPSLHKMSMMAHRVRVMEYNTFRLNVCVCASYNADFDGDEMNAHMPQSLVTHVEISSLAAVPQHIVSPRDSKPIVTIVQDVALGVFRLTHGHVRIARKAMMNLLASSALYRPLPAGSATGLSGRQALSCILPRGVNIADHDEDLEKLGYGPEDTRILVRDGVIESGIISGRLYKKASMGFVHTIYNDRGPAEVVNFLDATQKLICDWLVTVGFSVGVSDIVSLPEPAARLRERMQQMDAEVSRKLDDIRAGRVENVSKKSNAEFYEGLVKNLVTAASKEAETIGMASFDSQKNRMLAMIYSGSKGKRLNFTQMVACVGQQTIEGERIPDGFDGRTLPHFTRYDDGADARGFVRHSFIEGLTPQEFFFHAMGGRIGLIDTAVKSVTGDTELVIVQDGAAKWTEIGPWIDGLLAASPEEVERHGPEERNMELLNTGRAGIYIPTCDADGRTSWGRLTAVTRHDPGDALYEVVTEAGRRVTVAASQSLIVWSEAEQQFLPKPSPEVREGDSLPVTAFLAEPPVVVGRVDVSKYLPKTEYIHGDDFHLADRVTRETQGSKYFIPKGWWSANNGTTFTLPYSKKALLTRATSGRSNVGNIRQGCVYPYHATRCHGHLPATFELDEENGIFIGLFLADGHTCDKSGVVGITKSDKAIQGWVKAYFEKLGFTTRLADNSNDMGASLTMVGHSSLFARFLDRFVGHGSANKHVPDEAFTAPKEFVRGLLNGYFSGDGTVDHCSITSSSTSKRLTEGIAHLCSRAGAFGMLAVRQQRANSLGTEDIASSHAFDIRAQFACRLAWFLGYLVHPEKSAKLDQLKLREAKEHRNHPSHNDVVKDRVKSIVPVEPGTHKKLYDVTVPSTLNFALANGLNTRDTSETGYLQRKLVKAMEDCKVSYDLSVRNAAGHIIQFMYGDDGMDAVKLEYQHVCTVKQDVDQVLQDHMLVDPAAELPRLLPDGYAPPPGFARRMRAHCEALLADRRFLITKVHGGEQNTQVVYPVNVRRIVESVAMAYARRNVFPRDLDPAYVLDAIDRLAAELRPSAAMPRTDEEFMAVLLRAHLSPKVLLRKHRLTSREGFDIVVQDIRAAFYRAIAQPGDMVGIVAAQSLGEPLTQMSQSKESLVLIWSTNGSIYKGPIDAFVDGLLARSPEQVAEIGPDSVVMPIADGEVKHFIVGVSNEEQTSWRQIVEVSRHPANGGLVRIRTASGRTTCATLTHSFLRRVENGIVPVLGSDLKVGDRVPIARYVPMPPVTRTSVEIGGATVELSRRLGWLCGAYLADGSVTANTLNISKVIPEYQQAVKSAIEAMFGGAVRLRETHGYGTLNGRDMTAYPAAQSVTTGPVASFMATEFGRGSFGKRVPGWVHGAGLDFIRGLLGGYFDGDGNVNAIPGKQMIRSCSVNEGLTQDVVMLLTYVGIYASKCKETYKRDKDGEGVAYTAQIGRKHARRFRDEIGLVVHAKAAALEEIIAYVEREDAHSLPDKIDMIPELGDALARVGAALRLEGQSRLYGRFAKKEAVGRRTLQKFMPLFEGGYEARRAAVEREAAEMDAKVERMRTVAAEARAAGAKYVEFELDLADLGVELARLAKAAKKYSPYMQYAAHRRIGTETLARYAEQLRAAADEVSDAARSELARTTADLALLRQAADADVVWDEIVEIEHLPDPHEHVYDFTVPGNDSFMVDCGVLVHNTLNTFHLAGTSNKGMQGIPRLRELLAVTKSCKMKTPVMDIYLKPPHCASLDAARLVASAIQTTTFRSLVSSSKIYFDADDKEIERDAGLLAFYKKFEEELGMAGDRQTHPWLLRFELRREAMLDACVSVLDLEHALRDFYGDTVSLVLSDDNAPELVCRLRLTSPDVDKQDMLTELKALEQSLLDRVVVKGVPGIDKTEVEMEKPDGLKVYDPALDAFGTISTAKISTSGTNLVEVLGMPEVDVARTTSNDVCEIYDVLGVEAARNALFNALRNVMWATDKDNVNQRHMALLVDVMTNRGTLQQVNRYGINRGEIGPLAKCSFEQTTEMLVKAGAFSELDKINGVSANIMLGQIAPCGTGDCRIVMDDEMLKQYAKKVPVAASAPPPPREKAGETEATSLPEVAAYVAPVADPRVRERQAEEIEFV
jgi:DNA-directed RNA polymerase beta' subunit